MIKPNRLTGWTNLGFASLAALASCALLPASATSAHAALLAYEGFDYTPSGTNLYTTTTGSNDESTWDGKNGGTGWGSAWGVVAGTVGGQASSGATLTYTDSSSNQLPTTGIAAIMSRSSRSVTRQLSTEYSSGTYWLSFLIRPDASQGTADTTHALYLALDNKGTGSANDEVLSVGDISNTLTNYAIGRGSSQESGVATTNQATQFLVVRYSIGSTTSDGTVHLFVNPSDLTVEPSLSSADAVLTGLNSTLMKFDRVSLRTPAASPVAETGRNRGYFDEIRLGESYTDVTTVPEPASLGFLGVASVALLSRRRSR